MKHQLVAITAAFTPITASTYANSVSIMEDGSGSAAGLKVKFPDDNFTAVYEYPPAQQPIRIGQKEVTGDPGRGKLIGTPAQDVPIAGSGAAYVANTQPATVYCQIASMGADTAVRVEEKP